MSSDKINKEFIVHANHAGEIDPLEVMDLFERSDFPDTVYRFDEPEVHLMLKHANVQVFYREGNQLMGLCLCMSNFANVCFLFAIAVDPSLRLAGIGKKLLEKARSKGGGEKVTFTTVSTPNAIPFYKNFGFERCKNGFILPRTR